MDKTTYKSIRGEKDFLFRYFQKEGGKVTNLQQFNMFIGFWIQGMGIHPQQGIQHIINFLDKKFGK